jgi:hypothetical protein
MDTAEFYRDIATVLLTRATEEDGLRSAVLRELASCYVRLADQVDGTRVIDLAMNLAQSLH